MNVSVSLKPKIMIISPIIICLLVIIIPQTKILAQYGSISGIVTDIADGAPLEGVRVTTDLRSSNTDSLGAYSLNHLSPGAYDVCFSKSTYEDACRYGVNVIANQVTNLDMCIRQVFVGLAPLGTITLTHPGANRIRLKDDYAVINSDRWGIQTADISVPESTRMIGSMPDSICTYFDMNICNNYVYSGCGPIQIVDISDISHPALIERDLIGGNGYGINIRGNYAYIAASEHFYIYDISNPRDIGISGYLFYQNGSHFFYDVGIQGDYAYTADLSFGMTVINIADPAFPEIVGGYRCNNATNIFVRGNYAYLGAAATLFIIDISNPTAPIMTGHILNTYSITDIIVQGNYAYLAGVGLQVVNTENPSRPVSVYLYETSGFAGGVDVSNDYIYVADNHYLVTLRYLGMPMGSIEGIVTDVDSIPLNGVEVELADSRVKTNTDFSGHYLLDHIRAGPCSLTFSCPGYNVVGDENIIVSTNQTITVNKVLSPTSAIVGMITDLASRPIGDVEIRIVEENRFAFSDSVGKFNFVGLMPGSYDLILSHPDYHDSLFQNIDVAQNETTSFEAHLRRSSEVEFVGSCTMPGNAFGLALQGNYLYTASSNYGMYIINIANPQAPVVISQYGTLAWARELCVRADLAFIADEGYGVEIVNISNPMNPVHVGNYSDNAAKSIDVQGDYAYVMEGEWYEDGSLYILNISNPTNPVFVSSYFLVCDLGNRGLVRVRGSYAYFNYSDMLAILDISNPYNPHLAGSLEDFWIMEPGGLAIEGNYVYTTGYDRNILRIIDISDPQIPNFVGINYNFTDTRPYILSVQNGCAYSADYNEGICIIDVTNNIELPSVVANYNIEGTLIAVLAYGDYIYTANDDSLMILRFNGTGQVTGTVYHDSAVISNVIVRVLGWPQCDTTNATGHFQINNVHQGMRSISFTHEQYADTTIDVDVILGNTTEMNPNLRVRTGLQPNGDLPSDFSLSQNYPNPFNPATTIRYCLPASCSVKITVFNILGQKVTTLLNAPQTAGEHQFIWDASAFPSGLYFARLESGEKIETIKMVLLK
jgi:hypothetical protein